MNNFEDLTVVIVTFKTNKKILSDCLESINKDIKVILVENNNDNLLKEEIEKTFSNVTVILSDTNLGYGGGNNLGYKNVNTRYMFISNPDTVYPKNFFSNLKDHINSKINFSIIGASYPNHNDYLSYGGFNNKNTEKLKEDNYDLNGLKAVDWVVGCSMLIDLQNLKTDYLFDEKIFFFYDETDLCRRVKKFSGIVFNSNKLIVEHLGQKGSIGSEKENKIEAEKFRNWHLMWSEFYYHKKHDGFIYSFRRILGKLLRSLLRVIFYSITNQKEKKIIYKYRLSGILNSIMGKKSWYRIK